MTNFLATLFDAITYFWPFVIVEPWEKGVRLFAGRVVDEVPPGLYAVVPWFMSIETASIVPAPVGTPLANITLRDGKTLSYSVVAIVRVFDAVKALTQIDDYEESIVELLTSRMSEKLTEIDATRIDPENRGRLLASLRVTLNNEAAQYGVAVEDVRFTNFALEQRAYRLLVDTALTSQNW